MHDDLLAPREQHHIERHGSRQPLLREVHRALCQVSLVH